MNLRNCTLVQREVAVVRRDVRLRTRDPLGQPAGMGSRDEPILLAVADEDRNGDRLEPEAPGRDKRQVVVEPAVDSACRDEAFMELLREGAVESRRVDLGDQ